MRKQYVKTIAGIVVGTLGLATTAMATPISMTSGGITLDISSEGVANAEAAESAYLASVGTGLVDTETFEGFDAGYRGDPIHTSVGSFSLDVAGSGGLCEPNCDDLAILDEGTSPFKGRFPLPEGDNENWLDSMDAREMTFTPNAGINSIGFYMTDPNDAGGRFSIGGIDFGFGDIFGRSLGNGKAFYISLTSAAALGPITIFSNNSDDGYGIDNVSIASVPEPGTLALLGFGLLGIGLGRSRRT